MTNIRLKNNKKDIKITHTKDSKIEAMVERISNFRVTVNCFNETVCLKPNIGQIIQSRAGRLILPRTAQMSLHPLSQVLI